MIISDEEEETFEYTNANEIVLKSETQNSVIEQKNNLKPVYQEDNYILLNSLKNEWWTKLCEKNPENIQCKIDNCLWAPPGHMEHKRHERSYSFQEDLLIIQFLVHYNAITKGKGILVWEEMQRKGYMRHRSVYSLLNHFKRNLLRDIKKFKLPTDIESEFINLYVSNK